MADFTIRADQLHRLATTLGEMAPLTPPPSPKGRYVVAKALPVVTKAAEAHSAALKAFLDGAVTQDADGQPQYTQAGALLTFEIRPEHQAAYAELQAEMVPLAGVRQLLRAELGDCPVTIQQELALVACGFLEDAEPA